MEFTGERYVPGACEAQISVEHWHRYLYAAQFVAGKTVLDVACGEGYGSYLLADRAERVVGVDIDAATIRYNAGTYTRSNLRFVTGAAQELPAEWDHTFDVVVSFETIEHLEQEAQLAFLDGIKRVLKPGGLLLISSPNKLTYSDLPAYTNSFHLHELYINEFRDLLGGRFQHVALLGQKMYPVSYLWSLDGAPSTYTEYGIAPTDRGFRPMSDPKTFVYAVAVCSDQALPEPSSSLLLDLEERYVKERDERALAVIQERDANLATLQENFAARERELIQEREANVTSLRESFAATERELIEERSRLSQELSARLVERETAIEQLRVLTRALEETIQTQAARLEEQAAHLEEQAAALARQETNEERLRQATEALAQRERHQYELENRLREARAALARRDDQLDTLRSELIEKEASLAELAARFDAIDTLRTRATTSEDLVSRMEDTVRYLHEREANWQSEVAFLHASLEEQRRTMESLQRERDMWREHWSQVRRSKAWRSAMVVRKTLHAVTGVRGVADGPSLEAEQPADHPAPRESEQLPQPATTPGAPPAPSSLRLSLRRWRWRFPGSALLAHLDSPDAGATSGGAIAVRGWAITRTGTIDRVEVLLDGEELGTVPYGRARADVAAAFRRPNLMACGFEGLLPARGVPAGTHTLLVRVRDTAGHTCEISRSIVTTAAAADRTVVGLVEPRPGTESRGRVTLEGWVVSPAEVSRVDVAIDGQTVQSLPLLALPADHPLQGDRGGSAWAFQGAIEYRPERQSTRTLSVRAMNGAGSLAEESVDIRCLVDETVTSAVESAVWRGTELELLGWVIWTPEQEPRFVRVSAEGQELGQVRVKLSRPDIAAGFPDNPAARRCGFHFTGHFPEAPADRAVQVSLQFVDTGQVRGQRSLWLEQEDTSGAEYGPVVTAVDEWLRRYEECSGEAAALLDWGSGLNLPRLLPERVIFSPPMEDAAPLPYLDHSISVVLSNDDPGRIEEARRVAAGLHLTLRDGEVQGTWLGDASPSARLSVSIIIPAHNKIEITSACLDQLQSTLRGDEQVEIIVVDDASTDDTAATLEAYARRDSRFKVLHNDTGQGFLRSSNLGARAARGDILIFLNNDTLPQPGWLSPLLHTLAHNPRVGAVGGKLLYPDGRLQEAGGVIFSDGSGWNFGKYDPNPDAPLYNFVREVDYCSGAFLATPRRLFEELGGFDLHFAPAYYEDTDYCFTLRQHGYRVYYQPESAVIHLEGASSGTDLAAGAKRYQVINQQKFIEKWHEALQRQPAPLSAITPDALHLLAIRDELEPAS